MENEYQATKIEDSEEKTSFNSNTKTDINLGQTINLSLKGTTLGEKSDFEKELYDTIEVEKPVLKTKLVVNETSSEESNESISEDSSNPVENKTKAVVPEKESVSEGTKETATPQKTAATPTDLNDIYGMNFANYNVGDIITGNVLSVEKAGIFVDIHYKCEGFVSNEELGNVPSAIKSELKEGDEISLFLIQLETKEGYTLLSKKRADWELAWKEAYQSYKLKEIIDVEVINSVKGGLVVHYKELRGFIPASLVRRGKNDPLTNFTGQTIPATFIEVDKKRKKIILSNKVADSQNPLVDPLNDIEVGQVVQGKVSSIKDFGAFVNINGIEGLIHISELSWDRIDKVEDILQVGQTTDVFILGIDKESRKVSLGLKQLTPDPWETVDTTYPIDSIVKGTISRITDFGAFVKLDQGLEGLIHVSELSQEHVKNVNDIVSVGQEVEIKVLKVMPQEQKIGLSLKQANSENNDIPISEYQPKEKNTATKEIQEEKPSDSVEIEEIEEATQEEAKTETENTEEQLEEEKA